MPGRNTPISIDDREPRIFLDFSKKDTPKMFDDLSIDDDVMVILRGKVKSLNQDERGNNFSVQYTKLEIVDGSKPKTFDDAVEQLQS